MVARCRAGYAAKGRAEAVAVAIASGAAEPLIDGAAAEALIGGDAWNSEHRSETPLQRADRNFAELLQELRVAQTGVQILFAFLLTLSFMDRFTMLDAFQRGVYVFTLVASATTVFLFLAPVAVHRLVFQRGRKRELVRAGHRIAMVGLISLTVTVLAGMLLVLDVVVGRVPAVVVVVAITAGFITLSVGVPCYLRRSTRFLSDQGRSGGDAGATAGVQRMNLPT
jgi:hypothetical protein